MPPKLSPNVDVHTLTEEYERLWKDYQHSIAENVPNPDVSGMRRRLNGIKAVANILRTAPTTNPDVLDRIDTGCHAMQNALTNHRQGSPLQLAIFDESPMPRPNAAPLLTMQPRGRAGGRGRGRGRALNRRIPPEWRGAVRDSTPVQQNRAQPRQEKNEAPDILDSLEMKLQSCAIEGKLKEIRELLKKASAQPQDPALREAKSAALSLACQANHPTIALLLIKNGADLHATGPNGRTPLAAAVESHSPACVRLLLENGACLGSTEADVGLWHQLMSEPDLVRTARINLLNYHLAENTHPDTLAAQLLVPFDDILSKRNSSHFARYAAAVLCLGGRRSAYGNRESFSLEGVDVDTVVSESLRGYLRALRAKGLPNNEKAFLIEQVLSDLDILDAEYKVAKVSQRVASEVVDTYGNASPVAILEYVAQMQKQPIFTNQSQRYAESIGRLAPGEERLFFVDIAGKELGDTGHGLYCRFIAESNGTITVSVVNLGAGAQKHHFKSVSGKVQPFEIVDIPRDMFKQPQAQQFFETMLKCSLPNSVSFASNLDHFYESVKELANLGGGTHQAPSLAQRSLAQPRQAHGHCVFDNHEAALRQRAHAAGLPRDLPVRNRRRNHHVQQVLPQHRIENQRWIDLCTAIDQPSTDTLAAWLQRMPEQRGLEFDTEAARQDFRKRHGVMQRLYRWDIDYPDLNIGDRMARLGIWPFPDSQSRCRAHIRKR